MTEIVRDVMKKNVISIDSSMTVQDAAKMMDDASIGAIVVLEKGIAMGIITERDMTRRIVAKGKPLTTSVKEAIERAFDRLGGASYLEHVGRTDPRTFCALLSKLLPTKLANADGSPLLAALTELTDAQLEARTARALLDAQRAGLMAPPDAISNAGVVEVQAEVINPVEPVAG